MKGHKMVLFSRNRKKLDSAFYSNHIPFELVETDYRSELERIMKGADALVHLAGTFNISCGEPISHLRFAESVNRAFGNKGNLKMASDKKEDTVPFFMSPTKAERELRWKSKWNLDTMMGDLAKDLGK
jgi:hypothetical protein